MPVLDVGGCIVLTHDGGAVSLAAPNCSREVACTISFARVDASLIETRNTVRLRGRGGEFWLRALQGKRGGRGIALIG